MKSKFTFVLTALLMSFAIANAQVKAVNSAGNAITDNLDDLVKIVMDGSNQSVGDVNNDGTVNVVDIVEFGNMTTVDITVKNASPQAITIQPRFEFILNSEDGNAYKTKAAWGNVVNAVVTIDSGGSYKFEKVKISQSKEYQGKKFFDSSKSNYYESNVLLYDENNGSKTYVADMINPETEFKEGGEYEIVFSRDLNPTPSIPNPVISFDVNIINQGGSAVTLDGDVMFILGNPDHNGNYLGWDGSFNHTDRIRFSDSSVTLAAGEMKTFKGLTWEDVDTEMGMGEKSPLDPSRLAAAERPRNVLLFVDGSYEVVTCENMDPNIVFENGGTYDIVISSVPTPRPEPEPEPEPTVGNPVISIGINLVNNTGTTVTLDGDIVFVMGNPDHNGTYMGYWADGTPYTLPSNRTDHIRFSGSPVTIAAGSSASFGGLTWRDSDCGAGMGEKSPLDPSLLASVNRLRNVLVYVDGNSEIVLCDNMDPNIIFKDGETYTIVLSSNSAAPAPQPQPEPEPEPQPTPTVGNPVISIGINLVNNTGTTVTLDGDIVFVMGNPDHNGTYMGYWADGTPYTLPSNRTDHIRFSGSPVTIAAGSSASFGGLTWRDSDCGAGMGEKSPLDPSLLASVNRLRNVLVYVDGNSEIVLCDNMDPNIIFKDGETYTIVLSSNNAAPAPQPQPEPEPEPIPQPQPEPEPQPTPTVGNPVISIGINLVNNTGTTVTLDGDIVFVMGNPDHNGTYMGYWADGTPYTLPSNRTDHITFSGSRVTLAPGEVASFGGLTWRDADCGAGMGEKSPLHPSLLASVNRPRNVLVYVDGNSEIVLCENMDPSIIFRDGETYTISLSSVGATPTPVNPTPVNPTPSVSGNPVITIGVNLINRHGSAVALDGDIVFVMGNPDHNGNYMGFWADGTPYTLFSNRTDHIYLNGGAPIYLGAGESKTYYFRWQDSDCGAGMGEKSPLDPSLLAAANRKRNVLLYVNGNSEIIFCQNLSSSIIFREGEVYDIIIE